MRSAMLKPRDYTISVDKGWTLEALTFHDELAPIFFDMNWSIMWARSPRYFITSDNPLVYEVPREHRDRLYSGGLVHHKVEVTLPLSAETCLLATWNKDMPAQSGISSEGVKGANRRRAVYARRFLFGPRMDAGINRLAAKYKHVRPDMRMSGPTEFSPVTLRR